MDISRPATFKVAYRPDIDGLRAVAVLLVVFNHAGIARFAGGFVGVDVFFVISGYLISSLILRDVAAGRFSVGRFYERRFRRIMPAFLATLLVTTVLAHRYLFPLELKSFARSQLGALFSVSNVVLLHQTGYFDPAARLKPLLHTWSLGVEEQFYIVFPLLLLALVRWGGRHLRWLLWAATVVLLGLACYWAGYAASEAFFLAPYRVWELLCGTLLAAGALPAMDRPWKRNAASAIGLVWILWPGVRYQSWTPFPGWHAIPPCVGALLILAAGETGSSAVGRVLAWKPLRWIGLISYSLYLWHWPIQVFQTTSHILVPDRAPRWCASAAVIVASIAIAAISWKFVEQPFRTGNLRGRVPLFAVNGGLFAAILCITIALIHSDGAGVPGMPQSPAARDLARAFPQTRQVQWGTCYVDPGDFPRLFAASSCLAEDGARKHYLLVGDSHAAHAYWGLKTVFPEVNFSQITVAGCVPLLTPPPETHGMCDRFRDFVFRDYLLRHRVDTVLLAGRWSRWDATHMGATIDWIRQQGMRVIVLGPAIEFDESLVRLIELASRENDSSLVARHRFPGPGQEDQKMRALAREQWHVPYISMYEDLCDPRTLDDPAGPSGCAIYGVGDVPLLWDADHLSPAGSVRFAQAIRDRGQLP